jgi:hypothetical protein
MQTFRNQGQPQGTTATKYSPNCCCSCSETLLLLLQNAELISELIHNYSTQISEREPEPSAADASSSQPLSSQQEQPSLQPSQETKSSESQVNINGQPTMEVAATIVESVSTVAVDDTKMSETI